MHLIPVRDNYEEYAPPLDFSAIVKRLLLGVSADYLRSIGAIVLTNSSRLNPSKSRIPSKGRKVHARHISGLYHHPTKDQQAWIELYVDNLFPPKMPSLLTKVRFLQDAFVGRTLFHEIGHHIDHITARENQSEHAAEKWMKQLLRQYMKKHYWYLRHIVKIIIYFLKIVRIVSHSIKK
jgi:hypothetical protein